jgi:hypothetical protein
MKIVMVLALALFSASCLAETEVFYCHLVDGTHEFTMTINYEKKEIYYDKYNIYDIKHINEEYITSYARLGTGAGVGGGVEVFNRKTLLITSSDIEHIDSPPGTDELSISSYKSQCKK